MLFCGSAPFPLPVGQLAFHPCPRCLQAFHTETARLCPRAGDRGLEEEFKAGLQMCMGLSHSGLGLSVQVDQHARARTHTHTRACVHHLGQRRGGCSSQEAACSGTVGGVSPVTFVSHLAEVSLQHSPQRDSNCSFSFSRS